MGSHASRGGRDRSYVVDRPRGGFSVVQENEVVNEPSVLARDRETVHRDA